MPQTLSDQALQHVEQHTTEIAQLADEIADVLRVVGELDEQLLGDLLLHALHRFDARVLFLLVDRFLDLAGLLQRRGRGVEAG